MSLEGSILDGKYRILRQIGSGGMGRVFEAVHEQTERTVAVKVLTAEAAQQPDTRARFDREARAAGRIGHDNICEVVDVGFAEHDVPYLVMPLLRGQPLSAAIRAQRQLPLRRCIDVTAQILAALSAAHAAGVVHRDLKPDNVFLVRMGDRDDFVKVLDFGISKVIGERRPDATLTQTGTILGTPYYMSPEQARGMKDLDVRVDVYAMGAILYQMLTGQPPFDGDSYNQLLSAILLDEFPRPSVLRPDTPPALEELVLRATRKDREQRYRDAGEMREALFAAVSGTSLRPSDALLSATALASGATLAGPSSPGSGPPAPPSSSGWAPTPLPSSGEPPSVAPVSAARATGGAGAILSASRSGQVVLADTAAHARRPGPWTWALAAIVVIAAAAVAIYAVGRAERRSGESPRTAATAAGAHPVPAFPAGPGPASPRDDDRGPLERLRERAAAGNVVARSAPDAAVAVSAPPAAADATPAADAAGGAGATLADAGAPDAGTVRLTLTGLPDGARVRVDGADRDAPVVELPRGPRTVKVEVRARGYELWTRDVSCAENAQVAVELRRSPERLPVRDAGTHGAETGSIPAFGEGP